MCRIGGIDISFNILTDPWVEVEQNDGSVTEYGMLDVLKKAHKIRYLHIAAPGDEYAVHRFISVFLFDALHPDDTEDVLELIEDGKVDMTAVSEYVSMCEHEGVSFDLFDAQRPFMQTPIWDTGKAHEDTVRLLINGLASGNNHCHFDHPDESVWRVSPARAFRAMLSKLVFITVGGKGYGMGINGFAPPYYAVVRGANLFESLMYSVAGMADKTLQNHAALSSEEHPVLWRRTLTVGAGVETAAFSWMEALFFHSRKIRLIEDDDGMVSHIMYGGGEKVPKGLWQSDPEVVYYPLKNGLASVVPRQSGMIWDNIAYITGKSTARNVAVYAEESGQAMTEVILYGMATSQATVFTEVRKDLELPTVILTSEMHHNIVEKYTAYASKIIEQLSRAYSELNVFGNGKMPSGFTMSSTQQMGDAAYRCLLEMCNRMSVDSDDNALGNEYMDKIRQECRNLFRLSIANIGASPVVMGRAEKLLNRATAYAEALRRDKKNKTSKNNTNETEE